MSATKQDVVESFGWLEHQRILFISAFAVGAVGVIVLRTLGIGIIFTSIFALAIMTIYMLSGVTKKFVIRPDVLGDNLYYLGFLFTLVSMAYSLYSLGIKKSDINAILENFGLAISTTLYGLALRVFFNQTRSDLEGYESAVRISLTDAAANLIGELSKIGRDLATTRLTFSQAIDETIEAQKKSLEQMSKINRDFLNETVSAQREEMVNLIKNITEMQNKFLKEGADNQAQNLNKLSQLVTNKQIEMDRIFEKNIEAISNGMNESLKLVKESVQQFAVDVKKFAPATAKVLKEFDKFSDHAEVINDNLVTPLITIKSVVAESSERLGEVSNSMIEINRSIGLIMVNMPIALDGLNIKYENAIKSQIQFYDSVKYSLNESINNLIAVGQDIKRLSIEISDNQTRASQGFIDSSDLYGEKVKDIVDSFWELKNNIESLTMSIRHLNQQIPSGATLPSPGMTSASTTSQVG